MFAAKPAQGYLEVEKKIAYTRELTMQYLMKING